MNSLIEQLAPAGELINPAYRGLLACLLSFIVTMIIAPRCIRELISLKIGQPIRTAEEVHKLAELHGAKAGTPTMGGVMIVGTTLLATLVCGHMGNPFILAGLLTMVGLSVLGFADDYLKVTKKTSDGISARKKLLGQLIIGILALGLLFFYPDHCSRAEVLHFVSTIFVPFYGMISVPVWLYIPFGIIVIIAASNAVNLTDGLDGLASGCSITTALAYTVIALVSAHISWAGELSLPYHPGVGELAVLLMGLVGSCLGFLWYNCFPAKVFMGDTGSLAIGGLFGIVAICTAQELLFIIIGGIFVMEATSVVLQVGSYKLRHGKRIFAMAPIHHHFELKGWKETQVITRFWMIGLILAFIGLFLLTTAPCQH